MTSDRGRQFISSLWSEMARSLGTQLHRTTSYHPQTNGMVEREAHVIKHSHYYGETDFSKLLVKKPGLSILSVIIQSVNAKFDEFESFVSRINLINPISAICLQECWLGDADNITMFNLENYEMLFLPK